jgi:hypothetical protein
MALPPSPPTQTRAGFAVSRHENDPDRYLEELIPNENEKSLLNRMGDESKPEQTVLDAPSGKSVRAGEQTRQLAQVPPWNQDPMDEVVTENDDQDCGRATADDDVGNDDGVSDGEQTLVEFQEPKTTEQAASKLVASSLKSYLHKG